MDAYPQIGSICSGGRYENLAGHYTRSKLPGVGISIGLTRLFYQLQDAGLVATADSSVDVLVALLDDAGLAHALALSQRLRAAGLNVETQLEPRKLARQFQYADKAGIRFVVMRGEDEAARGVVTVKDLRRGEQFEVAEAEVAAALLVEREQLRSAAVNSAGVSTRSPDRPSAIDSRVPPAGTGPSVVTTVVNPGPPWNCDARVTVIVASIARPQLVSMQRAST